MTDCKKILILLQELGYLGPSQQEAALAVLPRVKRSCMMKADPALTAKKNSRSLSNPELTVSLIASALQVLLTLPSLNGGFIS